MFSRHGWPAVLVAAAAAYVLPHSGIAAQPLPTHITISSEGARPPYNFLDGDKLEGFEIDLGHELCRRMSINCTFVMQPWDELIPDLVAHRSDAIMAAMEITPERAAEVAFSTPYVRMPSAFLMRKTSQFASAAPDDLAKATIGVEQGGTHERFVEHLYGKSRIRKYGSLSDAILDLEAGRVDVAIGDKDAIVDFLRTRRDAACCRILADVPRDPTYFGDGVAIAFRKDDADLRRAFDTALAATIADGTFQLIAQRYFAFPINPAGSIK